MLRSGRAGRISVPTANPVMDSTPGAPHPLCLHGGIALLTGFDGIHGLVYGSRCALCGGYRFVDCRTGFSAVVARRLQHVTKHGRQFRRVPGQASLLLPLYVVTDFCVFLRMQGTTAKGASRVGVSHGTTPGFVPSPV